MGNYVPIKTCGVSDDLSGDMLAPSWPNLVYFGCVILCSFKKKLLYIINLWSPFGSTINTPVSKINTSLVFSVTVPTNT